LTKLSLPPRYPLPNGPVIVKTNRNCGGGAEGVHAQRESWLQRKIRGVRRRLHWTWRSEIGMYDYKVFSSPAKVPLPVWFNPGLVVERFLPERHDGYYCMRTWIFLGDDDECKLFYAKTPIVKSTIAVRTEDADIPDELREIRRKLGFDYGKFDFGVVDGRVVLYDPNRTPMARKLGDSTSLFNLLASGVDSIFTPHYRKAG
jgi:hypothetical protein